MHAPPSSPLPSPGPSRLYRRGAGLVTLGLTILLVLTLRPGSRTLWAQAQVAVHFEGTLTLGGAPASAGVPITVITYDVTNTVHQCGSGSTSGSQGAFTLDVPAIPFCAHARTHPNTEPHSPYIFEVGGIKVGESNIINDIDVPSSLGTRVHVVLRGPGG